MSKHHSLLHTRVFNDIRTMKKEDLEEFYGIEISEDGAVYDLAERLNFTDLHRWAAFYIEREEEDGYSSVTKIGSKHSFDDEY